MGAVVGASLSQAPSAELGGQDVDVSPMGSRAAGSTFASTGQWFKSCHAWRNVRVLGGRKRKNSDKPAAFAWACEEQGRQWPEG